MTRFFQDLRYGARVLRRAPGFSVSAILLLSLAIGANTAMFSVIEGVLLRPLPYKDADRLCVLWKSIPHRNIEWDWTSAPTIQDWREQNQVFEDLALVLRPEGSKIIVQGDAGPEKLQGSIVSRNFFDVLGVQPLIGRTFSPAEENVAVLSHRLWQQRFGGDSAVLGQVMRIDDRSVTVIGVMPPPFEFPDKDARLWLLLSSDPRWTRFRMPQFRIADAFVGLGRLKPGRSLDQARTEMAAVAERLAQQHPATDKDLGIRVIPLFDQVAGSQVRGVLWSLGAAVVCILLIACSNLASLLVSRSAARAKELAIRAALGAGRARLAWQLATESLLLSLIGGIGGVALAYAGLRSLLALAPADLPRVDGIAINGVVLAFSFALCLLTGLVCGLLPAWRLRRFSGVLVAAQFALAIVLLSGAGLLVRSFLLLNAVDRGFDTTRLLTVYDEHARGQAFLDEAVARIAALPGIEGAVIGSAVFDGFRGNAPNQHIVVEGRPFDEGSTLHSRNIVGDGYFRLLGLPLVEGRVFSERDTQRVAVINEKMARQFWPAQSAVGKRFKQVLPGLDGDWIAVAGVVRDAIYNRDGAVIPIFYPPARQWSTTNAELVVRTKSDPHALIASVRHAVQSIDPSLPRFEIAVVDDKLAEQDRPRLFQAQLIGIFSSFAVILSATGLYGLMSYSVTRRTKEIGIRVALGSTSAGVAGLVLKQAATWAGLGVVIGIAGTVPFGRALSASLYGVAPGDPLTLAGVVAVLLIVMLAASAVPSLRASKVDPTIALRHD
jgi:putative ABC transport system permease protein